MTPYEEQVLFLLKKISNNLEALEFRVENLERRLANPNILQKNTTTVFRPTKEKELKK